MLWGELQVCDMNFETAKYEHSYPQKVSSEQPFSAEDRFQSKKITDFKGKTENKTKPIVRPLATCNTMHVTFNMQHKQYTCVKIGKMGRTVRHL